MRKLMKGNEAIAEAAIQAGCRFFFGYPITPQNQIPEYMSKRMPQVLIISGGRAKTPATLTICRLQQLVSSSRNAVNI